MERCVQAAVITHQPLKHNSTGLFRPRSHAEKGCRVHVGLNVPFLGERFRAGCPRKPQCEGFVYALLQKSFRPLQTEKRPGL